LEATGTAAEAMARARRLLLDDPALAVAQAREIVRTDPGNPDAWRLLGAALRAAGDEAEAEQAELDAISASVNDPRLLLAAHALVENDLPAAEPLLRAHLREKPTDAAAIRMMAELAGRLGRLGDAETLLRRALALAPAFSAARANLATILYRQNRTAEALAELDLLLAREGDHAGHQNLKAAVLGRLGSYEEAIDLYERVLGKIPGQPKVWMSYGHALKTVGRQQDGIAAYRRAVGLAPTLGEVWWSLANLKTVPFTDADVAAMETALAAEGLGRDDRLHLHFAVGKALEEKGDWASSFAHYAEGNRIRDAMLGYDPGEVSALALRSKRLLTAPFFAARAGYGCPAPDPIFILGMPRSGSTLVEQILASHERVEGTMELPDLPAIARKLGAGRPGADGDPYPASLAELDAAACRALGEEYLERTRIQRKTGRPFFIDKLPNNWVHVGLIQLILPNARIVDARRHPLDCCFSNFKQHYARGQAFSYTLDGMGRYYADYVALLAHYDAVLPGRVHRIVHERLIDEPEAEITALLDYLGLEFDPACLAFHENKRAVRTASSEQVRRPLNREGVDQWRPYEAWLGPLKEALGPVLEAYPDPPLQGEGDRA
jgi:tetratricopeptide (TPR) repeat protein